MAQIPTEIRTHHAWQFDTVLPGNFRRYKDDYADIDFPILAPLPDRSTGTAPREGAEVAGPFLYFVTDRNSEVFCVGKSKEKTVIKRWVRPGIGGSATHCWTHTNKSAGCVRRIADAIQTGCGPFQLRLISVRAVPQQHAEHDSHE